jgi:hypothetical protein
MFSGNIGNTKVLQTQYVQSLNSEKSYHLGMHFLI